MNKTNAALARIAASDGSAPYSAYFADQEPIDGKITVVDLIDGACRWPTGNPRDLKTFRYCGESARALLRASRPTCLSAESRLTGGRGSTCSERVVLEHPIW